MLIKIKYKKNPHQKLFHEDDLTTFLHLSGGYGSGKSFGLIMKGLKLSYLNMNLDGGLVCPTFKDFARDIRPLMENNLDENRIRYQYHKTEHWYKFPWSTGKLYVTSAENKIKGPNWAYCLINELTLIPFERYQEAIARVRVKGAAHPQIVSCGTPEGLLSGYFDWLIDKPNRNTRVIYGSTEDNAENLSDTYLQALRQAYDSKALEAYEHGKFINFQGSKFYYAYNPLTNEDRSIKEDPDKLVHVFLDFNVSPMIATVWHCIDTSHGKKILGFDEITIDDGADTRLMCQALKSRGYTPERTHIYPDPAGKARSTKGMPDNEILKAEGFYSVHVRSKAPLIRKRQLAVCALLEQGRIMYNPDKMPNMRKDFLLVEQDKVTLEKVKKNPLLTHASDGLDYGTDILFEDVGRKPQSQVFKLR